MASPFVHLAVADAVAPRADIHGDDFAPFLFGSVAPDVDKIGLCSRETSHFWSFSEDVSGALKLLRAYPQLAARRLAAPERAFIAGYLCHLVTDEQWMFTIYRPYFGRRSPYGGSREGQDVQWALHLLLEGRQLEEDARIHHLVELLAASAKSPLRDDLLPFIAMAQLGAFRQNVLAQFELAPGAQRARFLFTARRGALANDMPVFPHDPQRPERFIANLPTLTATAATDVPPAALEAFYERAVEASVTLLRDYLAGRSLQPPPGTVPLTSPAL
jgi:hypothetical protein